MTAVSVSELRKKFVCVFCVSSQSLWNLTAGKAKKDTPIRVNVAARRRPFHVMGYLSPYPIVVSVIYKRH